MNRRAPKGALSDNSPGLRDDAQGTRDGLFKRYCQQKLASKPESPAL